METGRSGGNMCVFYELLLIKDTLQDTLLKDHHSRVWD